MLVDVRLGRLTLRLRDDRVVFNLSNTLKQPSSFASCSYIESVDISDALMEGMFSSVGMFDLLERIHTDEDFE